MSYIEQFWRDATAADVARVMAGETVEARFLGHKEQEWEFRALAGWYRSSNTDDLVWASTGFGHYRFCQVYAPPLWWLNKPNPGEDFRLLAKFPDEAVQGGDFIRNAGGAVWTELPGGCNPAQVEGLWYRRRIEPPKPEPKHYVLQVGDTADVPSGQKITITEHGIEVT